MSGRYSAQAHQRDRTALFGTPQSYVGRSGTPNSIAGASTGGASSANQSGTATPYRAATPNSRGQYSTQTYDDLESQNDQQLEGLFGQVKKLKEVTTNIGDHIKTDNKFLNEMVCTLLFFIFFCGFD